MLTQEYVQSLLKYDPETGNFVWLSGKTKGKLAGFSQSLGYIQICINGKFYYAHRLAWLYTHGEWPTKLIDHIDGRRANNAIDNLRQASSVENGQNQRKAQSDNKTSGLLGVSKKNGRWRAAIKAGGKSIHIGTFDTPTDAHEAYLRVKRNVHKGCLI